MGRKIEGEKFLYCNLEMGCLKILHSDQKSALSKSWKIFVGGVEKSASGEKNRINYYPFGMIQPGRSFSSPSCRYGYQGSEKDDEVSGSGNSYTTFYRGLDPRLGRWKSIDPKSTASWSPYNSMNCNPIWFNDPLGDKIKYNRGEGVSRKEFRQAKKIHKKMRKNSASFNTLYSEMDEKKDKNLIYNINLGSSDRYDGLTSQDSDGNVIIDLNIVGFSSFVEGLTKLSAHETTHGYRQFFNLENEHPKMNADYILKRDTPAAKKFVLGYVAHHQHEEKIAMHGENIIIGELLRSGEKEFKGLTISQSYFVMKIYKPIIGGLTLRGVNKITHQYSVEVHQTLLPPVSEESYLKNTHDIKVEILRTDLRSESIMDYYKRKLNN